MLHTPRASLDTRLQTSVQVTDTVIYLFSTIAEDLTVTGRCREGATVERAELQTNNLFALNTISVDLLITAVLVCKQVCECCYEVFK